MTERRPLRVALLTHSTNPRGGVVHALALADALTDLGFEVVVHAPDFRWSRLFSPNSLPNHRCPRNAGWKRHVRHGQGAGWRLSALF